MRYALSEYEWTAIKPMLPNKLRGIRVLMTRAWSMASFGSYVRCAMGDLPENYGPYRTCSNRFVRWRQAGIWGHTMEALAAGHDAAVQMIVASVIRVGLSRAGRPAISSRQVNVVSVAVAQTATRSASALAVV